MSTENPTTPARRPEVLSRGLARELGIAETALGGASFTKLSYDAYVPAGQKVTTPLRARTALQVVPQATRVSHHTAVTLWGGVAPDTSDIHLAVASPAGRSKRRGITSHLAEESTPRTTHRGLAMSTPTQAFLELAASGVSLVDLVIAGDSLVKATKVPPAASSKRPPPGRVAAAGVAREAAGLVREGVDSPMETRLRLLIVFAGLPEPRVNLIIRDREGGWRCRFDLAYEECKVVIEYDGRQHAEDDKQWLSDLERRELLDRWGWRIIVITRSGIYQDPEGSLRRIRPALAERGRPDLPKRFAAEYTRHFPARG